MNRTALKYIAIIAMTLDHIGIVFFSNNPIIYLILKVLGRITFPIMCLFIAEGYKYTSNKKKYALRLLILAIISQIPYTLMMNNTVLTINAIIKLNAIFSLFLGYLLLLNFDSRLQVSHKILITIPILATLVICDYTFIAPILIMSFYYLSKSKRISFLPVIYLSYIFIETGMMLIKEFAITSVMFNTLINLGIYLTIPLIYLYNEKRGINTKFNKYFFYIYYPLHMLILSLISFFVN